MDDSFKDAIETVGRAIDVLGVGTIVAGVVLATLHLVMRRRGAEDAFRSYRQDIGRAILLGLEFLGGRGHHPYRGGVTDVHERRRLGPHRPDQNLPELYLGADGLAGRIPPHNRREVVLGLRRARQRRRSDTAVGTTGLGERAASAASGSATT
jgi:hypothetical protein